MTDFVAIGKTKNSFSPLSSKLFQDNALRLLVCPLSSRRISLRKLPLSATKVASQGDSDHRNVSSSFSEFAARLELVDFVDG